MAVAQGQRCPAPTIPKEQVPTGPYAGRVGSTQGEVLVVGGGVIGMTSAFRLARAGWRVTLFDPAPGSGATWAAAGMIAPSAEVSPGEEDNFKLHRGALAAWRDVASDIFDQTGATLEIIKTGNIFVRAGHRERPLL